MLDLFSGGGGGWCLAARALGIPSVGIEWDGPSCRTRAVVGLATIRADVSTYPAEVFAGKVGGICGGPPCQSFSSAGKGKGLDDPRGQMVYEPMRYVRAIRPRWVALEQVPEVLGYWRWIARELGALGYSAWTGILQAADYGVPQCRRRAILLASLDHRAVPPAPTHSKHGHAPMFGPATLPWVSMAEALGWTYEEGEQCCSRDGSFRDFCTGVGVGAITDVPGVMPRTAPAAVLRADSRGWRLRTQTNTGGSPGHPEDRVPYECDIDRPAPTVLNNSVGRWKLLSPGRSYTARPRVADPMTEPAPTVALGHNASSWCWERPATTIPATFANGRGGKCMVAPPGHHTTGTYTEASGAIPVEPWELGVLQGFPADHPWQPPRVSAQIGNAIPPPLAEACLRAITGAAA